jgi:hypothetical protein
VAGLTDMEELIATVPEKQRSSAAGSIDNSPGWNLPPILRGALPAIDILDEVATSSDEASQTRQYQTDLWDANDQHQPHDKGEDVRDVSAKMLTHTQIGKP